MPANPQATTILVLAAVLVFCLVTLATAVMKNHG